MRQVRLIAAVPIVVLLVVVGLLAGCFAVLAAVLDDLKNWVLHETKSD